MATTSFDAGAGELAAQRVAFEANGFVVLRGALDGAQVRAAREAVDASRAQRPQVRGMRRCPLYIPLAILCITRTGEVRQ